MEIIMKKVKMAVWVLIIAFVIVLIYQNQEFFLKTKQTLSLNLIFAEYKTPELEIIYFSGIFFLAGLLLGFYFLTAHGLKTRKKIKVLNAQVTEHSEKVAALESERGATIETPVPEALAATDPDAKTVVINPDDPALKQ